MPHGGMRRKMARIEEMVYFCDHVLYYFTYCNQHGIFVLTEWQYRIFSLVTKCQKTQSVQKK